MYSSFFFLFCLLFLFPLFSKFVSRLMSCRGSCYDFIFFRSVWLLVLAFNYDECVHFVRVSCLGCFVSLANDMPEKVCACHCHPIAGNYKFSLADREKKNTTLCSFSFTLLLIFFSKRSFLSCLFCLLSFPFFFFFSSHYASFIIISFSFLLTQPRLFLFLVGWTISPASFLCFIRNLYSLFLSVWLPLFLACS